MTYYEDHKEKILTRCKEYRKKNRKKILIQKRKWYQDNLQKVRQSSKAYYKANKDRVLATLRAYRIAHLAQRRAWRELNLDKNREDCRKRRALKRTTQIEPMNEKTVYLRDGWKCQHCKIRVNKKLKYPDPMSASLDHIVPLNRGGSHTYSNVQLAHFVCNISKQDRTLPQGEQLRIF